MTAASATIKRSRTNIELLTILLPHHQIILDASYSIDSAGDILGFSFFNVAIHHAAEGNNPTIHIHPDLGSRHNWIFKQSGFHLGMDGRVIDDLAGAAAAGVTSATRNK